MIFIHGLGGDAFGTWRDGEEDSNSWPHWLGAEFSEVGVWSLGYAASPSKWTRFLGLFRKRPRDSGYSMALPDRALQVLDLMVQCGLGERPLLFVCHSLGGLLVKQILRKADDAGDPRKKQIAAGTRAVLFLATPHAGAALASLMNAFRAVFGATVSIEDLRAHDAHLADLYDWYRNHAAALGIETVTYFETRGIRGMLPIVNRTSAHPGVGADPVPLDEDHLSIAKPRSRDAQVCGAVRDLLNYVLAQPQHAKSQAQSLPAASTREPQEIIIKLDPAAIAGPDRPRITVEAQKALSVFLCHSSGDKASVRDLYHRLVANGIEPWLDEENLLPGQNWNQEIRKAVRNSDVVIVCLSRGAIDKAGYVQKEIRYALDLADEQPEGTIFLIPLWLEECEMPERLCQWQYVKLFENKGYERLMQSLRARAKQLDRIIPQST